MTKSLRERKKARTHQTILEIATRLFRDQGYAETTLEQICSEAEVSVQTLLRYFDSKEALALSRYREGLQEFRERIRSPKRSESGVEVWRAHVRSKTTAMSDADFEEFAEYFRFVESVPALLAGKLAILREYEDLVTGALCEDAGTSAKTDFYNRLLAASLIWGHTALMRHVLMSGIGDPRQAADSVIDTTLEHFPPRATLKSVG